MARGYVSANGVYHDNPDCAGSTDIVKRMEFSKALKWDYEICNECAS